MVCSNKDVLLQTVNGHTSRKILSHSENLMAVEVRFKGPSDDPNIHEHAHEQIAYVVKGRFEFIVKNEKYLLETGDTIYFEPHTPHGALLLDDEGILLDIFTPRRDDFITNQL